MSVDKLLLFHHGKELTAASDSCTLLDMNLHTGKSVGSGEPGVLAVSAVEHTSLIQVLDSAAMTSLSRLCSSRRWWTRQRASASSPAGMLLLSCLRSADAHSTGHSVLTSFGAVHVHSWC